MQGMFGWQMPCGEDAKPKSGYPFNYSVCTYMSWNQAAAKAKVRGGGPVTVPDDLSCSGQGMPWQADGL